MVSSCAMRSTSRVRGDVPLSLPDMLACNVVLVPAREVEREPRRARASPASIATLPAMAATLPAFDRAYTLMCFGSSHSSNSIDDLATAGRRHAGDQQYDGRTFLVLQFVLRVEQLIAQCRQTPLVAAPW